MGAENNETKTTNCEVNISKGCELNTSKVFEVNATTESKNSILNTITEGVSKFMDNFIPEKNTDQKILDKESPIPDGESTYNDN